MEKVVALMNRFVEKVNEARAANEYAKACEYLDMLCGAMCAFNEYELGNRRQVTLGEVNHRVFIEVKEF